MPVYHITLHAYRTWSPAKPQGYLRHHELLPQDYEMAGKYDEAAAQSPVQFDPQQQQLLIDAVRDIAPRRDWRVHIVGVTATHLHVLISWRDEDITWRDVRDKIKSLAGLALSRAAGMRGKRWWARKGSRNRVRDREQLANIIAYIRRHANYATIWEQTEA